MTELIPYILMPIMWFGVRKHLRKKSDYTRLKRITLSIALFGYFLTETGRSYYRPYIYANNINDSNIADTLGNTFGTVTAIFFILTFLGKGTYKDWKIVVVVIAGLMAYEFINLTGKTAVEVHDIIATLLFGFISAVIYRILLGYYGNTSAGIRKTGVEDKLPVNSDISK